MLRASRSAGLSAGPGKHQHCILVVGQGAQLAAEQLTALFVTGQERRQSGVIGQGNSRQRRALQRLSVQEGLTDDTGDPTERATADQEEASALIKGCHQMFGQAVQQRLLGEQIGVKKSGLLRNRSTYFVLDHTCLVR